MTPAKFIVDIFGDVVKSMQTAGKPAYLFGHPLEIVNTLTEWTKSPKKKFDKFPLIILFQDFEETKGISQAVNAKVSLNVVICTDTLKSYKSEERYANTFKKTLYPLYDQLMQKIEESNSFIGIGPGLIPHTKIDRVYWGQNGNTFNDYIDAIEIQNLELEILNFYKNC